jgi:DNA polymerase III subunit delta
MSRTRKELEQSLKKGQIEPVYFLHGSEAYLREQAVEQIANAALEGTLLREFNDIAFDLTTDKIGEAIAAAEQLPLMSQRRVVRIRNLDKIEGRRRISDDDADEDMGPGVHRLVDYLQRPVATSVLILSSENIDKRKKYAKMLLAGAAYEFAPLTTKELPRWIESYLSTLNTDIEPRAVNRLVELVASDLHSLTNELNKLANAALPSGRITADLVDQLVSRTREHMNWDLTDNILSRNRKTALKVLREFLDDGVEPVLLTGVIAGTFRRLALARALLEQGAPPREIFSEVRVPQFKQSAYLAMLKKIDSATMGRMMARIAETDLAIKTSKATPRMQVEMLVCELMI